ncbi:MAG: GlsB/YeaQ/YmgE family stress response membrane protein [Verrucomicrobia bacterium]|nr:GlsB/YeaQ/YmgE family stress response membrane protein [Verrucomicrobiota bacterium]
MTLGDVIVWLVVGGLAGSFVGMLVKREKKGFGHLANLAIGLVGAVIGGLIFELFKIDLKLGDLAVTFEDLISAVLGAVLFMVALAVIQKLQKRKSAGHGRQNAA